MKMRNPNGQALVELAFSLLLLFFIVFGIAEVGRAMYMMNTLNYAAREGVRRAAVSPTPLNIPELTTNVEGCIPFDKTGLDVQITPPAPASGSGSTITVSISLPFTSIFPFIAKYFHDPGADSLTLRGEASMRYEN